MKRMTILVAVMLMLTMAFPAAAEESPWTDGMLDLEGSRYVLVLPEGMVNAESTTDEMAVAKSEDYGKNGGLYIGVALLENTTVDDARNADVESIGAELKKEYGSNAILPGMEDASLFWMLLQASRESGVWMRRGRETLDGDEFKYIFIETTGSSAEGRVIYLYLPAEENVYRLTYIMTEAYFDEPANLFYGTLMPR